MEKSHWFGNDGRPRNAPQLKSLPPHSVVTLNTYSSYLGTWTLNKVITWVDMMAFILVINSLNIIKITVTIVLLNISNNPWPKLTTTDQLV